MYLRFVRLNVREGEEARFAQFYRERVIGALDKTPGCRFAGLLQPWRGNEHRSLTIWDSVEAAEAYEKSGLYSNLLRQGESMLAATTRWRVRLGDDPLETTDPSRREIPPDGYVVDSDEATSVGGTDDRLFVRIVSIRVDPARSAEFREIFHGEVEPAVEAMDGCRGVFLAAGAETNSEVLSISFWDTEQDALRYEMSGEFERLSRRLEATYSPTHSWKIVLGSGDDCAQSKTPDVSSYHLVQAKQIEKKP